MTASPHSASVVLEGVSKRFGEVAAVDNIDLRIGAGSLVTLLGPSGCGKTTTLRMIAGLEAPTSGRIVIGDRDVTLLPPNERDVSMVFQSYALFPHMTVMENVAYGLQKSNLARAERLAKGRDGLKLVGLEGFERRRPSELSGGQQQRVAVARALVLEPKVLLFDEPLSNLDAKLRRRMREEIRDLQLKLGLTSVYVTHDQEEALAVSDTVVVMNKGIIAQEGTPRDLYEKPANSFVADFVGGANLLPVRVEGRNAKGGVVVALGEERIRVADTDFKGQSAFLVVRPNAVTLSASPTPGAIAARITKATYLGSHWEYSIELEGQRLFITDTRRPIHEIATVVYAEFDPAVLVLIERY